MLEVHSTMIKFGVNKEKSTGQEQSENKPICVYLEEWDREGRRETQEGGDMGKGKGKL